MTGLEQASALSVSNELSGEMPAGKIATSERVATPSLNEMPELPTPETGLEGQSSYLQMLSEREPERVAHVVKQWMTPKNADS